MTVKKTIRVCPKSNKNTKPISIAFDEFILDCRARNLSPSTINNYTKSVSYFIDYIPKGDQTDIYSVDSTLIKRYMLYLLESHAINSVRTFIKNIRIFFRYHKIEFELKNVGEEKKILESYTDEEIKLLLIKPTRKSFGQIRVYTIVCFLLATGVRTNTLINIKIKHIDLKRNTIFLDKTKTHKQYTLPMSSMLQKTLEEYLASWEHSPEDYLFPSIYGDQLSAPALRRCIAEYHISRGVKSTSLHKYRRTFATNYLRNCNNVFFLQQLLGHSDISTTRRYCSINLDDLQQNFDSYCVLDNMKKKRIQVNKK